MISIETPIPFFLVSNIHVLTENMGSVQTRYKAFLGGFKCVLIVCFHLAIVAHTLQTGLELWPQDTQLDLGYVRVGSCTQKRHEWLTRI